jgi:hypothetical protein
MFFTNFIKSGPLNIEYQAYVFEIKKNFLNYQR